MDVLAQHHRVHDRQNARAAVIIPLDLFIIREQPRDRRRAFVKQLRDVERQQRVELTCRKHPLQRLPSGEEIEPDVVRQIERDQRRLDEAVEPAHEPVHVLRLDAVIVLQHAAHEDEAGRAPLRRADAFTLEVLRRVDAGAAAHVDAGMTEHFGERDRHRHERAIAAAFERRVGGKRKLGDLKLLVVEHALERLTRTQDLDVEIDALRLHAPVDQRPRAIVIPAGEGELEIGHRATYGVGACCGWRKRTNGGRNTSGSALIAIGTKAKRGLAPRSHAAPLSTDTRSAWL